MTQRLTDLMRAEASALDIPAAPAAAAYAEGHRLRRRRRLVAGISVAGVLTVIAAGIGVGTALLPDGNDVSGPVKTADPGGFVYSVGRKVYVESGEPTVTMDYEVRSLDYTSAGVLVRTRGYDPETLTIVRPDGSTKVLNLVIGEQEVATDPVQPYLAFAEADDDQVSVVVVDVRSGEETARVAIPGELDWITWDAPPVALSGDYVYVGTNDGGREVNWRTGKVEVAEHLDSDLPSVHAGRRLVEDETETAVIDVRSGDEVFRVPTAVHGGSMLSLDGRFVAVNPVDSPGDVRIYSVATGDYVTVPNLSSIAWTADGQLVGGTGDGFTLCDATSGRCQDQPQVAGSGDRGNQHLASEPGKW